jgi:hypothetical protein
MADSSLSRHPLAGVPGLERFARTIVASQVAFAVIALRYNNGRHRRRFFTAALVKMLLEMLLKSRLKFVVVG